jgi:hypothetical protein
VDVPVPDGCSVQTVTIVAETRDVFDRLVKEHEASIWGEESVSREVGGERRSFIMPTAYWHDEVIGLSYHLHAPKRYVEVTLTDA